ncbi:MAG: amidase [Actinomycetota bacterium]|jgi:aspartyl-tRNA(Asn)/glutamyl-tRNA(Gln) amidotransferase subunit A|nr:amidase [Actinomycetota bacterium]
MATNNDSIHTLASGYRDGSRSPIDAVEQSLAAVGELDGKIGAWQAVYADEARAAARAADAAIAAGHRLGPFQGVPFALKDIVDVEGRVTTAGCAEWRDRVSPATATVGARLLAAGGILVGKTKTVEFAMGGWGTNQHMGTPWNPWDADVARTPGGSSCGSGAAVSSGMITCAVGTDTGGSVRLPAALCGIVGLKTTEGLLPIDGIVPLSHTLDTPGPMARSVDDTALMFDAMLGTAAVDIEHDWATRSGRYRELERGVAGLRFASLGDGEREGVEAAQLDAYDAALETLAGLGATIVPFDPPKPFEDMKEATFVIVIAEAYHHHRLLMDDVDAQIDENVRGRIRPGIDISARDYVAASLERQQDQADFLAAFDGFDALLTPTTPMLPVPTATVDEDTTPARFTRAGNYLAMCGTSLPSGVSSTGLPTSLQVSCRGGEETLSLRIAKAYETARGPMPVPPLFASAG